MEIAPLNNISIRLFNKATNHSRLFPQTTFETKTKAPNVVPYHVSAQVE